MRDLVLIGGGHAHVHVLKQFGERPLQDARVTLVGRDVETPYSGMIPGFVAGHYSFEECHIDLAALCARSGARLVHAEATGIDRAQRQVLLKDQPAVPYDLLSIDVGSAPNVGAIAGAEQWAIPVKPIAELGRRWLEFSERMKSWLGPLNVVVIGGGAGGVELALAIDHRLREIAKAASLQVTLATKDEILAGQAEAARRRLRAIFQRRGIRLLEHAGAQRIERGAVRLEDGQWQQADAVFVVTEASAAPWFADTGLPLDEKGFLAVDDTLASTGDARIFAAGDCATVIEPSPAQGGRVRGAPGPAARRQSAARARRRGGAAVHPATSISLAPRHRRWPCRRHQRPAGRSKGDGCGGGRTTSIASGCGCIASRIATSAMRSR